MKHKVGEILDINIEGATVSCIVIKGAGNYDEVSYLDQMLFLDNDERIPREYDKHWYPLEQHLGEYPHWIAEWEGDGGDPNPCCQLLIGDQKVWMSYNNNKDPDDDGAW